MMILLFALQALPAPPLKSEKPVCPAAANDGDVVVCGRAEQEQFRLRPLPSRFEKRKTGPGLEFDLGKGAKANFHAIGDMSPDRKPDKRIMATVKIPF